MADGCKTDAAGEEIAADGRGHMKETDRFIPIDIFRGAAVAGMILVNTPGSWAHVFPPLRHADWHGVTTADLVFPFFLFITGYSMAYSFSRRKKADEGMRRDAGPEVGGEEVSPAHFSRLPLVRKIAGRTAAIFLIGFLINWFPFRSGLEEVRIMGVLQRIALAWCLSAVMTLFLDRKQLSVLSATLLAVYWIVLRSGGGSDPFSLEGNLVRRIDLLLLGGDHLWQGRQIPFDPEGLLSTVPAVVSVLIGYISAIPERPAKDWKKGASYLLAAGAVLAGAGLAWAPILPINKSLWTSSYVLFTSGCAMILMAPLIWLTETAGMTRWAGPLRVFGMNPLFIFAFSAIWVRMLVYVARFRDGTGKEWNAYSYIYEKVFAGAGGDMTGSLLFALAHIVFYWFILWLLYRKRVFIRI